MLLTAKMLRHLFIQPGLQDRFRELLEQPVRAGEVKACGLGLMGQFSRSDHLQRRLYILFFFDATGTSVSTDTNHAHLPRQQTVSR